MDIRQFIADNATNPDVTVDDRVILGENIIIGPSTRKLSIGYGSYIGRDIYIDVEDLSIGEYVSVHHGSVLKGIRTRIGHNCWFGHYTVIDSVGGDTRIGNNVGVGAHSQLWSHMKFGDQLNGCRWASGGSLVLEDDVWLVGHSITGPIHAGPKAMLMTGSVAVHDLEANHIYSGAPAKDMTSKFGTQFEDIPLPEKILRFTKMIEAFLSETEHRPDSFAIVDKFDKDLSRTQFDVANRSYRPIRSEAEYEFIKFMLYEKAKWLPEFD